MRLTIIHFSSQNHLNFYPLSLRKVEIFTFYDLVTTANWMLAIYSIQSFATINITLSTCMLSALKYLSLAQVVLLYFRLVNSLVYLTVSCCGYNIPNSSLPKWIFTFQNNLYFQRESDLFSAMVLVCEPRLFH